MPNDVALPIWEPAYFWNTDVGFEMTSGHFALRLYLGRASVINSADYSCSEGQGCNPVGAASLVYVGSALGYAF